MTRCVHCDAILSAWEIRIAQQLEVTPCWCRGVPRGVPRTLANLAYAELCHADLMLPVRTHDVVRFVDRHWPAGSQPSMNRTLSQGHRFCWGGQALYGLARHGLLPGPRSLAEAAYAVLLAAPRELHLEEVDFVLERLNYRYNRDSLMHHLRGYTGNRLGLRFKVDDWNRVSVNSGRDARHYFNSWVEVCPTHAGFDVWLEEDLAPRVEKALDARTLKLGELSSEVLDVAGDRVEFR